jgi:hypothetical protein
MGNASTCEAVCYGSSASPPRQRRDYEAEARAKEAAAREKATALLEKGLAATAEGELEKALDFYREAKDIWPGAYTNKNRYGGYSGIDSLISDARTEIRVKAESKDSAERTRELARRIHDKSDSSSRDANPDLPLKDIEEPSRPDKLPSPAAAAKNDLAARTSRKAVAAKQAHAVNCALGELQALADGPGEGRALLRAEMKAFLENVRTEFEIPCSGASDTHSVQTLSLSDLTRGAKRKEEQLEGSILVVRDEKSCEVHIDVQHAASTRRGGASRSSAPSSKEGQSVIRMDGSGKILDAETSAGVGKCLARP